MDADTETLAESILNGCVPIKWLTKSYPNLKSLANYVNDLKLRVEFWQVKQYTQPNTTSNDITCIANFDFNID